MPSHTFTRVGYWQESIDANVASGAVARRDGVVGEELHSMDYRTYAYLQTAQDAKARAMVDALPEVAGRFNPNGPASAAPNSAAIFAIAAIPARYAIERGAWAEAAALEPRPSSYPYTEALTHMARALGAAHTGNTATIKASIDALQRITDTLTAQKETYWAEQTEIQRREAAAWLALAEGRKADAVAGVRAAAEMEDRTEKSAVTPGPARAGARAARRDAAAAQSAGRRVEGVRGDAEEGTEPVPRRLRRGEGRVAGRQPRQGARPTTVSC